MVFAAAAAAAATTAICYSTSSSSSTIGIRKNQKKDLVTGLFE
jgi:hypothetical protein